MNDLLDRNGSPAVSVAILAGGQSSRMGEDKPLLRLVPDGPTMLETVIRVVAPLTDDLYVVASNRPAYAFGGVAVRPDLYEGGGVLGGIGSAIRYARHDLCLVVSCDHPFLSRAMLEAMTDESGSWDVLVPAVAGSSRQGGDHVRHTLQAIYRRSCVEPIERCLHQRLLRTTAFHADVVVRELSETWMRQYDPDLWSLFSVNTPESAEVARRRMLS